MSEPYITICIFPWKYLYKVIALTMFGSNKVIAYKIPYTVMVRDKITLLIAAKPKVRLCCHRDIKGFIDGLGIPLTS